MPLDTAAIARGCGSRLVTADQLCGRELDRFRDALDAGGPVTVSCTLQAPLFDEVAEEMGAEERVTYAKIRESAGWSSEAEAAGPKMAALLVAAAEPVPPAGTVPLVSRGVALVYGRDAVAVEAGQRLAEHLDVTVLLSRPGEVAPLHRNTFPVLRGTIRDQDTAQRRAFVRFFACEQDLSHEAPDAPLPAAVAAGAEPLLVVGAMAGG